MNPEAREPDEPIDALVREHLLRREAAVDARAVRDGVRRRLAAPARPRRRRLRWLAGGVAAAAAVVAGLLWGLPPGTAQASPETLVLEASAAHAVPVDRCYTVQTEWEPAFQKRFPLLCQQRSSRLWTRGDRFFIETRAGDRRWAWGRDDLGRVWVALGPKTGLLFGPDEVGDGVTVVCDMLGMRLESFLAELPGNFELRREDGDGRTDRIVATPKPGRGHRVRGVTLELDRQSRTVERVTVRKAYRGNPAATVTLTLAETGSIPDDRYQLQGQVEPDARILGPDLRSWRDRIWRKVQDNRKAGGGKEPAVADRVPG